MLILVLLGMYFDAVMVFVKTFLLLFKIYLPGINREMSGLDPFTITVLFQIKTVAYYLLITAFI